MKFIRKENLKILPNAPLINTTTKASVVVWLATDVSLKVVFMVQCTREMEGVKDVRGRNVHFMTFQLKEVEF